MKGKTIRRIFWIILLVLVLAFAGILVYIIYFRPGLPLREVKVEVNSDRVERGKYLANHVMVCIDCHSKRDWTIFSGPIVPGTEGQGGEIFDKKMNFPGKFIAPNITPFHLENWSDAEIYRAIAGGESKDGRPLFPVMPYLAYGSLDNEDLYSVIAYLRTLPPIPNTPENSKASFPMNIILHLIPHYGTPVKIPDKAVNAEYGKYLATAASCIECHTPVKKGQIIQDSAFAGGRAFSLPGGTLISANITPDPETGLGKWTDSAFITRFKTATVESYSTNKLDPNSFNSMMPWTMYSGMDTTDLMAVFTYLKTVRPIMHNVSMKFIPHTR